MLGLRAAEHKINSWPQESALAVFSERANRSPSAELALLRVQLPVNEDEKIVWLAIIAKWE
jgi:hypothetical protein